MLEYYDAKGFGLKVFPLRGRSRVSIQPESGGSARGRGSKALGGRCKVQPWESEVSRTPIDPASVSTVGNIAVIGKGAGSAANMQGDAVERLAVAFERSARRWEFIAYPAVVIFTLLAIYGFYQIYSVSRELRLLAEQLRPQMGQQLGQLTESMNTLTANIAQMSRNIDTMSNRVAAMASDTNEMAKHMSRLDSIDHQMGSMNQAVQSMAMHTDMMRWNIATMNRSIQKPMNFMNSFMPW